MSKPETGKGSAPLDVYVPVDHGPCPVVVPLHGGGAVKEDHAPWARKIARRGVVVYAPTWSTMDNEKGAKLSAERLRAALTMASFAGVPDSTHWELGTKGIAAMLDAVVPTSRPPQ